MDAVLWLIIVLFSSIIGLIVYLIVRKPEVTKGTKPYPTAQYCKYCGNPLPSDARFCPKCGREQT